MSSQWPSLSPLLSMSLSRHVDPNVRHVDPLRGPAAHLSPSVSLPLSRPLRYVVVPDSLGAGWARGAKSSAVVESIDLMVTLADLAGLPLPKQALGGETLRPMLLAAGTAELAVVAPRKKNWALSQWPRRPSCTTHHNCIDGHDDPFKLIPDQVRWGLRAAMYRYSPPWDTHGGLGVGALEM